MLKVLIVDDEILFRTNLKLMIQWEKYGFLLCKDAENGATALDVIKDEKPDIVISDIRMPVMDGIRLSEEISSNFPEISMIVLSNYDDYEYVRSTLKNGAVDYILKHRVDEATLLDSLERAKKVLSESKNKGENVQHKNTLNPNNLAAIKEKFITQLLTGIYENEVEIAEHLKILGINLSTDNVVTVLMAIDNYNFIISGDNIKDASLLKFAVINICEEVLNDIGNGTICHIGNERFVILLSFSNIHSTATIEGSIWSTLDRIRNCLKKFVDITVSFSISETYRKIQNIPESFECVENLLKERFYAGKNCNIKFDSHKVKTNLSRGLSLDEEKELLSLIKLKDITGLMHKLDDIFNKIKASNLNFTSSHIIFSDLLWLINRICKEKSIELSEIFKSNEAPHITLTRMETISDINLWIRGLYKNLLESDNESNKEIRSEYIKRAIIYLKDHYTDNISQADLARYLNLTNNYLSKLFNEELGIGFSEYLCEMRLEKAKALLTSGKVDLKDIASLCGFNSYTYFFSVFKKKTGITPGKFFDIDAQ